MYVELASIRVEGNLRSSEKRDRGKKQVMQSIMCRNADFLRRIEKQGGEYVGELIVRVPKLQSLPMEDFLWRVTDGHGGEKTKPCGPWCGACGNRTSGLANRVLTIQPGVKEEDTFVYKTHAPPKGRCGNLINVMKLAPRSFPW